VGLMRDPACLCAARANAGSSGSIVMRPIHKRMGVGRAEVVAAKNAKQLARDEVSLVDDANVGGP